eukprot:UN18449
MRIFYENRKEARRMWSSYLQQAFVLPRSLVEVASVLHLFPIEVKGLYNAHYSSYLEHFQPSLHYFRKTSIN